jgi:hypothetical protein
MASATALSASPKYPSRAPATSRPGWRARRHRSPRAGRVALRAEQVHGNPLTREGAHSGSISIDPGHAFAHVAPFRRAANTTPIVSQSESALALTTSRKRASRLRAHDHLRAERDHERRVRTLREFHDAAHGFVDCRARRRGSRARRRSHVH